METYEEIAYRAHELHFDAPWIYSKHWLDLFLADLDTAFEINDTKWIRNLINCLD